MIRDNPQAHASKEPPAVNARSHACSPVIKVFNCSQHVSGFLVPGRLNTLFREGDHADCASYMTIDMTTWHLSVRGFPRRRLQRPPGTLGQGLSLAVCEARGHHPHP